MSNTGTMVEVLGVLYTNRTYSLQPPIYKDGSALNLTGKTVTATIRNLKLPDAILHTSLEAMSVTLGNSEDAASAGGTSLSVELSSSYFWVPKSPQQTEDYTVEYLVMPDDYSPAKVLLHLSRSFQA